jgi:hypothetical protein
MPRVALSSTRDLESLRERRLSADHVQELLVQDDDQVRFGLRR